jgi:hypothetical protein
MRVGDSQLLALERTQEVQAAFHTLMLNFGFHHFRHPVDRVIEVTDPRTQLSGMLGQVTVQYLVGPVEFQDRFTSAGNTRSSGQCAAPIPALHGALQWDAARPGLSARHFTHLRSRRRG